MQFSRAAIMLYLLPNSSSSDAASVTEILSTMAEMEDSNNKIHALSRTLKKAQLQEGRLLDEIAEDKVDEKNEKADADTGVLAQVGTPCVYSNGTQGIKCVGYFACRDTNRNDIEIDRIGCGSCIGDNSCYGLYNTDVGEQSCIGHSSCIRAYSDSIGNNSCNGFNSCHDADNVEIGNNSCVGEQSCYYVGTFDTATIKIGNNSCIKDYACIYVDYDVGQDSCNGYRSCRLISGKKFANRLTI